MASLSSDNFATDRNGSRSPSRTGDDAGRRLLEGLLQHTLRADYASKPLSPKDREALKGVARLHRREPLSLEPVTVELVQAMLSSFFSSWAENPSVWRPIATRVARTLFEDGRSHERLRSVWQYSCEGD